MQTTPLTTETWVRLFSSWGKPEHPENWNLSEKPLFLAWQKAPMKQRSLFITIVKERLTMRGKETDGATVRRRRVQQRRLSDLQRFTTIEDAIQYQEENAEWIEWERSRPTWDEEKREYRRQWCERQKCPAGADINAWNTLLEILVVGKLGVRPNGLSHSSKPMYTAWQALSHRSRKALVDVLSSMNVEWAEERVAEWPEAVEHLNRFKTSKEAVAWFEEKKKAERKDHQRSLEDWGARWRAAEAMIREATPDEQRVDADLLAVAAPTIAEPVRLGERFAQIEAQGEKEAREDERRERLINAINSTKHRSRGGELLRNERFNAETWSIYFGSGRAVVRKLGKSFWGSRSGDTPRSPLWLAASELSRGNVRGAEVYNVLMDRVEAENQSVFWESPATTILHVLAGGKKNVEARWAAMERLVNWAPMGGSGCPWSIKTKNGTTPLMMAIHAGDAAMATRLFSVHPKAAQTDDHGTFAMAVARDLDPEQSDTQAFLVGVRETWGQLRWDMFEVALASAVAELPEPKRLAWERTGKEAMKIKAVGGGQVEFLKLGITQGQYENRKFRAGRKPGRG